MGWEGAAPSSSKVGAAIALILVAMLCSPAIA
jgi:hypothetical protein